MEFTVYGVQGARARVTPRQSAADALEAARTFLVDGYDVRVFTAAHELTVPDLEAAIAQGRFAN
jgi:hypothetical protein